MWSRIQTAVELIYPPRCVGCGELVAADFGLCGACWRELRSSAVPFATAVERPCRANRMVIESNAMTA